MNIDISAHGTVSIGPHDLGTLATLHPHGDSTSEREFNLREILRLIDTGLNEESRVRSILFTRSARYPPLSFILYRK